MGRNPVELSLEKYILRKYGRHTTVQIEQSDTNVSVYLAGNSLRIIYNKTIPFVDIVNEIDKVYRKQSYGNLIAVHCKENDEVFIFLNKNQANDFIRKVSKEMKGYSVGEISEGSTIELDGRYISYEEARDILEAGFYG